MSVAGISQDHPDRNILMKKSFHRRNDSDELDVFEAARYFSGYGEAGLSFNHHGQKMMKDDNRSWRGGRISLDMPMRHHALDTQIQPLHHHHRHHSQVVTLDHIKDKKYKQPSSPGGRLASFLNALFSQSASKKKKSKPSSSAAAAALKEDIIHDERRRRRSSMSHFRSSSTATTTTTTISVDTKSIYSSSSSGFRTPPAYAQTPSKSFAELKSFAAKRNNPSTVTAANTDNSENENRRKDSASSEKKNTVVKKLGSATSFDEERRREENSFNVDDDEDDDGDGDGGDGAESDSSSDLFELQNYDLGSCYSSDLPVYETTSMDKIKRGSPAPISSSTSSSMC